MNKNLQKKFSNPDNAYRGKPFWAWNGKLEEAELRRQIRIMRAMGMGGFFMHSRVGLATPYLSNEWHGLINACAEEAQKYKMEAWLYDEDRWPSGAAGGFVTKNLKYRQTRLIMEETADPRTLRWSSNILAVFTARIEETEARSVKRVAAGQRPSRLPAGCSLLIFRVEKAECSDWYNGYTYLDTLNHEAVKEFIRTTHESYKKHAGRHFGKAIPGIFTDEPNYGSCFANYGTGLTKRGSRPSKSGLAIPWTSSLPRIFKARYGYDLVHHLPEVYFDVEEANGFKTRHNYHDCITFLFVDAFARQIGQWCDRNNLLHTGHVLAEETLLSQTDLVGSCMRFYEHMQAPGMDLLTERRREYNTAKQVSSAARQFGRKWRLTETYGCTGWDFPFAGHKALGDWQAALGINLRCHHLSWYTMEGEAKRDYPAGIFFQSPWWESYPKVENYFARINMIMTRGEEVRDLLVIHPVESMWTMCRPGWMQDKKALQYDRTFASIRDTLLMGHIDFDYGDEDIMSRQGSVHGTAKGAALCVGKASYKAVLVPPLLTIRKTTLDLLARFRERGGLVVFAGKPPVHVDAVACPHAREFADSCIQVPEHGKAMITALEKTCRRLSITDGKGGEISCALYLLREDSDAYYAFICNTGHKESQLKPEAHDTTVDDRRERFPHVCIRGFKPCRGHPLELNPDTGKIVIAEARRSKGAWEIMTSLPRLGSRLFMVPKKKIKSSFPPAQKSVEISAQKLARTNWRIALSEPNNAVLDRPEYRIGAGNWAGPEEILRVDAIIRKKMGIPKRGGRMAQPWTGPNREAHKKIPVKLSYTFNIDALPRGGLSLAIEQPSRFKISVNDNTLNTESECGWWVDPSLRKIPIDPTTLKLGANKIVMSCHYDESHPGLEAAYLLGAFGVKLKDCALTLTDMPSHLGIGDWTRQGLPFYSGSVSYICRINKMPARLGRRVFLEIPDYKGAAVRIMVNGREAGVVAWEPNEVDITDHIGGTANEIHVEVLGHRRNSHGPLHHYPKHPIWTGPGQYVSVGDAWRDTYQLVPCGLMQAPRLSVRKLK